MLGAGKLEDAPKGKLDTIHTNDNDLKQLEPDRQVSHPKKMRKMRWKRIEVIIFTITVFINVVVLPLMYFYLIPLFMQMTVNRLGSNPIQLNEFRIDQIRDDHVDVAVDMVLDPFFPFPVKAGIGNTKVDVLFKDKVIAKTTVPEMDFWTHLNFNVNVPTRVVIGEKEEVQMKELVRELSTGIENFEVTLQVHAPIRVFGLTIYPSMKLTKQIALGKFQTRLKPTLELMSRVAKSLTKSSFKKVGQEMRNKFSLEDLIDLNSYFLNWSGFSIDMNDDGITVGIDYALENGSPFGIAIDSTEFLFAIENVPFVVLRLEPFTLSKGYQERKLGIKILFNDERISAQRTRQAIVEASKRFAESLDMSFSAVGPVSISNSFVSDITKDLKFEIPLKDIGFLFQWLGVSLDPAALEGLLTLQNLQNIFDGSTFGLKVLSELIQANLNLVLPAIPIPKQISFPYQTSLTLYGTTSRLLETRVDPILMTRQTKISANVSTSVIPVNTDLAAQEFGAALNPLFSRSPQVLSTDQASQIGLRDLGFQRSNGTMFKWCNDLFGETLFVSLPPIDLHAVTDFVTQFPVFRINGILSELIRFNNFDVVQSNAFSGFDVNIAMQWLKKSPIGLEIDLGFFQLDGTVESSSLLTVEMSTGLRMTLEPSDVAIEASTIFTKSPDIAPTLQSFVRAILNGQEAFCGVTGIVMGTPQSKLITFSRIAVDIPVSVLRKLTNWIAPGLGIPSPLVKVNEADIRVRSATEVAVRTVVELDNPTFVNVAVGSISFQAQLDNQQLLSIVIPPLRMTGGRNTLDLALDVTLTTNTDVGPAMEKLVHMVLIDAKSSDLLLGIVGFELLVSNPAHRIDVFKSVKVESDLGYIFENQVANSKYLDISPILPDAKGFANTLEAQIQFISLVAQENARVAVGADIQYKNILPVSLEVPFVSVDVVLDSVNILQARVQGIQWVRVGSVMRPRVMVAFANEPNVQDVIGKFMANIFVSKLESSISITKIQFGSSPENANPILTTVSIKVDQWIKPFAAIGDDLRKLFPDVKAHFLQKRRALSSVDIAALGWEINSVDLAFERKDILLGGNLGFKLPIPVEVNLPYILLDLRVDDVPFGSVSLGINANGTNPVFDVNTRVVVQNSPALSSKVRDFISNFSDSSRTLLGASGLEFGVSAQDKVSALKQVYYGVESSTFYKMIPSFSLDGMDKVNATARNFQLEARPSRSIMLGANVQFSNQFPVSISGLNYVRVDFGIDDVVISEVSVSGISLSKDTNSLNLGLQVRFPSSAVIQDTVQIFGRDLSTSLGRTEQKLVVRNLIFGSSQEDAHMFLQESKIAIQSNQIIHQRNYEKVLSLLSSISVPSIKEMIAFQKLDVQFHPTKVISLALDAVLTAIPIQVNLPFVRVKSTVDYESAFDLSINRLQTVTSPLALGVDVQVQDSESLASKFAPIVRAVLKNESLPGRVGVSSLLFGLSAEDSIDTFERLEVNIELEPFARPILNQLPQTNSTAIVESLGLGIQSVALETRPRKQMRMGLSLGVNNPLAISIRGLNYFSATAGIDGMDIVSVSSPAFTLNPGRNQFELGLDLLFPSSDQIKDTVAKFAQDLSTNLGKTSQLLSVSDVHFGSGKETAFMFLKRSVLGVASSTIMNPSTLEAALRILRDRVGNTTLPTVQKLGIDFKPDSIDASFETQISVPFQVTLAMPSVASSILINNKQFLDTQVRGLNIAGGNNTLQIATQNRFSNQEIVGSDLARLFDAFSKNETLSGTVGLASVSWGTDSTMENTIDTFSKVALSFDISRLPAELHTVSIPSVLNQLQLSISDLILSTLPKRTMLARVYGKMTIPYEIRIANLGYFAVNVGIDRIPFVEVQGDGLAVSPRENTLNVTTRVYFPSSDPSQTVVAKFVKSILNDRIVEDLSISGLEFGTSESNKFVFLQKILWDLPAKNILNKNLTELVHIPSLEQVISQSSLSKLHVSARPNRLIDADISTSTKNITLPASIGIGYLTTSLELHNQRYILLI
jgi:hypothetical protein